MGRAAPRPRTAYMLVGRPEALLVVERMDSMPFLLRGRWKQELEEVLLDNLEFVWRPCVRLGR
ncbi:hypothetical protein [Streptomyces sp. bgisy082]|uniref:hypothetical protein n=2 Tax=Streptomyces TaxID=1883 RepID=UPI003D749287